MYEKLSMLKWGPFAPRPFGVFPMIAINYNTISDYHWDKNNEPNSLCCLVALGDFKGGELCFPQLKIIVPLRPEQVIVFSSRLLLHGNFSVTRGIRHSVVYFVHSSFFHYSQNFSPEYKDLKDGIDRDANGKSVSGKICRQNIEDASTLNHETRLLKPKPDQIKIPPQTSDCRRGRIGKKIYNIKY
ncbi:calnexin independence factor cif1 [Gigaspora margarita]|uniref:Calnexin independence factor cif1 n=1 Tax=Gigaspora margarita TaxID=4874 RepID=A0A8H4AC98_GIGMA|nr:calnexin independence factor cif1 [Gigaspora margarita]